jgi:hypothetical protein
MLLVVVSKIKNFYALMPFTVFHTKWDTVNLFKYDNVCFTV